MSNQNVINKYRPEIDGLRAFAVLSVIINHFNKDILACGFLGVDIFFVISGYVITLSLFKYRSNNFAEFIFGFYERRLKRIVPLLFVFITITLIIFCLVNPFAISTFTDIRTALTSLFGLSNIYLYKNAFNYHGSGVELNPFAHTWSLGVEEQFYIIFPLLVWFSGFGKGTNKGKRNLGIILIFLTTISFFIFTYTYHFNHPFAYFLLPSRFWEISIGSLVYLLTTSKSVIFEKISKIPAIIVFACMVSLLFTPLSNALSASILMVFSTVILICCLKKDSLVTKLLTRPLLVYIGLISYSLYLWHWAVISISKWTIGIHWWSIPFQLFLIFILSIASYKFIESPFRKIKLNIFKKGSIPITLLFASVLSGSLYKSASLYQSYISTKLNIPLAKTLGMESNILESKSPADKQCEDFENLKRKSAKCFFFIGDSHAERMNLVFKNAFNSQENLGSALINGEFLYNSTLIDLSNRLDEISSKSQNGDVYIINFIRGRLFSNLKGSDRLRGHLENFKPDIDAEISKAHKQLSQELSEFVFKLNKKGAKLVFVRDFPLLANRVASTSVCRYQAIVYGRNMCKISIKEDSENRLIQDKIYNLSIEVAKAKEVDIFTWDPSNYLIVNENFYDAINENNDYIFIDNNHISLEYAKKLAIPFKKFLLSKKLI